MLVEFASFQDKGEEEPSPVQEEGEPFLVELGLCFVAWVLVLDQVASGLPVLPDQDPLI